MTAVAASNRSFAFEGTDNRPSTNWRLWRSASPTVAVLPGELATKEAFDHERERQALMAFARLLATDGLSWAPGTSVAISTATERAAQLFLGTLPSAKALPKISPDGEEGLLMVWDKAGDPLLVTVDDLRLHAVIGATTSHAKYIHDIPFDRAEIPQSILDAIPGR